MRRKIGLYIADKLVDLDDQSFILFNYTMDDLSNPTIVNNPFSKQITLKGTPANNRIFGHSFRVDRKVSGSGGSGVNFNASIRTPYKIYGDTGEILESGYVRLDKMVVGKEYKITLFSSLGDFFYNLSYNSDGSKRSLANLWYKRQEGLPEATELDFDITAEAVSEAWNSLRTGGYHTHMRWGVINFAPAYNGIPSDFSADKAILEEAYAMGVHTTATVDDVTYGTRAGFTIVNLANEHDEWAMKEFRSYLQRPVISVNAVLEAIADPYNNGGYTFDMSGIQNIGLEDLWITRPMLPALGTFSATGGSVSATYNPIWGSAIGGNGVISGDLQAGMQVTIRLNLNYMALVDTTNQLLYMSSSRSGSSSELWDLCCSFVQVIAYDVDDNIVGAGQVVAICDPLPGSQEWTCQMLAQACNFSPVIVPGQSDIYGDVVAPNGWQRTGSTGMTFRMVNTIPLSCVGYDVDHYRVWVHPYLVNGEYYAQTSQFSINGATALNTSSPRLWDNQEQSFDADTATMDAASAPVATTSSGSNVRSGMHITKEILLSSSKTPAEYLLGLAKTFGFYFLYDHDTKTVKVVARNDLYQDETIDLTRRIDTSRDIELTPLTFSAKWYDFSPEQAGGSWMDVYFKTYGLPYGIQRVNTGYDFDAKEVNLLEGTAFKSVAEILDGGSMWNYLTDTNDNFRPSVFLDPGNTVTLFDAENNTIELDISLPGVAFTANYYNQDYPGNDAYPRVEFRGSDGRPVNGDDVLVFFHGGSQLPYFKITDDISQMDLLNNGKPCWYLLPGSYYGGQWTPIFQRYTIVDNEITESLDWGVPKDVKLPELTYPEDVTLYAKRWMAYIRDRYDVSTKVMRCWVHWEGIKVGHELLRKFYWYGGSLWTLNKIINHSLTTYDPVECEFVQVQDKENYLNGQSY